MQLGFIGLKYSGKSTLFSLLTGDHYESLRLGGNEYFRGQVTVPDGRIKALSEIFKPKKTTYANFECIDVAGLPAGKKKDASTKYLEAVRQVDGLVAVIQAFEGFDDQGNAVKIDPVGHLEQLEQELIFTDLLLLESRYEKVLLMKQKGSIQFNKAEFETLERFKAQLEAERALRELNITDEELKPVRGFQFLSLKPFMAVINCDETYYAKKDQLITDVKSAFPKMAVSAVSAQIEKEIQELDEDERKEFMADLGIAEPAINQVIQTAYEGMGLISFFTVGEDEVRAWTVEKNSPAPIAAGKIHSDLQAGFIRAEVTKYEDFIRFPTMAEMKARGLMKVEGKEYLVQDGDILNIRFNL
ncbi:MAG TPA: redox-regulated ATPase YchF [Candidatus Marinimicrobia bacterium]|nr:redox-regulated ATPase YchF [Candidatus Neomarinimicrobiota bacterium]